MRDKRRALGYTQRELGERLGYSEKAISKWESGAALPPSAVLPALADALGVRMDELFSHTGEPLYYLGIDGGATKTDFVLTDREGTVLHRHLGASTNPADLGVDVACERLREGIRLVCGGISPRSISVFAGISGGLTGDAKERIRACLEDLGFARADNGSDAQSIVAAGLGKQDGISVIVGTGSVAFVQRGGELHRIGGFGYLFDEGGNGYAIGRDAIAETLWREQLGEPIGVLGERIVKKAGTKTALDSLGRFYEGGKREVASYAPCVIEAYEQGDETASHILDRNMACVARLIRLGREYLASENLPVVLVGGLMKRADVLMPMIERHLGAEGDAHISVYDRPAVRGALLLAGMPEDGMKEDVKC
jgi:N-acetylglucosamine kinase-like BadF-type ATPase